jgi:hypothetical protein
MRSSLAVKTLRKVNDPHLFDRHDLAISFLVSVQSPCSALRADPPPSVAHHSFTDHGKRFASLGGCYASELFVGSDTTVSQFVELCDALAESVTRRRTMGARVAGDKQRYNKQPSCQP